MGITFIGLKVGVEGVPIAVASLDRLAGAVRGIGNAAVNAPNMHANINLVKATGDASVVVGQQMGQMGNKAAGAAKKVNTLNIAFGKAKKFSKDLRPSLFSLGQSFASVGGSLTTMGFRIGMLAAPAALAFGVAVKKSLEFEDAMVKLSTLTGLTGDQIEIMGQRIRKIAPDFGLPANELAEAVYPIASRDITNVADVMELVGLAAKGAAIGMGEANDLAAVGATIFQVYKGDLKDTTEIFDKLLVAIQRGALEADEFSAPIGRALGLATGLGVTFDELAAFMATFSISGTTASEVVTGLNRVMATFLKPSKQAKDALGELFGTMDDEKATVATLQALLDKRGLAGAMKFIAEGAEAAEIPLSTIFTRLTGLNAALFTTGAAWEQYQSILGDVEGATGNLDAAFSIVQESVSFRLKQLGAIMQEVALSLGTALLPALTSIATAILPVAQGFSKLINETSPKLALMIAGFIGLATVAGPLLIVFGLLISSIGQLITILSIAAGALAFFLTPIGLVVAAIGVLGAAFGIGFVADMTNGLAKGEETLSSFVDRMFTWGSNIVVAFANGMASAMSKVLDVLIGMGKMITRLLVGHSPPKLLPDLPEWGANAMNEFLRGFTLADFGIFKTIGSKLEQLFRSIPIDPDDKGKDTSLISRILGAKGELSKIITKFRNTGSIAEGTLTSLASMFGAAGSDVQAYIESMFALESATRDVAEAQRELSEISGRYNDLLSPLKARADEISGIFNKMRRDAEKSKLERYLASDRAPEGVKEQARLRLEQLGIEEKIAAIESERDEELTVAQTKLDDAKALAATLKEEVELNNHIIEQYLATNKLAQEQLGILDKIADALDKVASAVGGLGDALGGGLSALEAIDALGTGGAGGAGLLDPDGPAWMTDLFGGDDDTLSIAGAAEEFAGRIQEAFAGVQEKIDGLKLKWIELGDVYKPLVQWMEEHDIAWVDLAGFLLKVYVAAKLMETLKLWSLLAWVFTKVPIWTVVAGGFAAAWGWLGSAVGAVGIAIGTLTLPFLLLFGLIALAIGLVIAVIVKFDTWEEAMDSLALGWESSLGIIGFWLDEFDAWLVRTGQNFADWVVDGIAKIGEWGSKTWLTFSTWLGTIGGTFDTWLYDFLANFDTMIDDWIESVAYWGTEFGEGVSEMASNVSDLIEIGIDNMVEFFETGAGNMIDGLIDGIDGGIPQVIEAIKRLASAAWSALVGFFDPNNPDLQAPTPIPRTNTGTPVGEVNTTYTPYSGDTTDDTETNTGGGGGPEIAFGQVTLPEETNTLPAIQFNTTINNDMDQVTFEKKVERVIIRSIQ